MTEDLMHESRVAGQLVRSLISTARKLSYKGEAQVASIVEIAVISPRFWIGENETFSYDVNISISWSEPEPFRDERFYNITGWFYSHSKLYLDQWLWMQHRTLDNEVQVLVSYTVTVTLTSCNHTSSLYVLVRVEDEKHGEILTHEDTDLWLQNDTATFHEWLAFRLPPRPVCGGCQPNIPAELYIIGGLVLLVVVVVLFINAFCKQKKPKEAWEVKVE